MTDASVLERTRSRLRQVRRIAGYAMRPFRTARELYWLREGERRAEEGWPPGHFYSPVPALDQIRRREAEIFAMPAHLPGIALNEPEQIATFRALASYYADHPYARGSGQYRYTPQNPNFALGEAIILHCMLRRLRPRRILEVGCGYSSAVILDTRERFLGMDVECTFVEPYPALLHEVMRPADAEQSRIVPEPLQQVDTGLFTQLRRGDLLFIDSTHVLKTDSDVTHLLFRILPHLVAGVMIHFHDIPYPFEYPREWIYQGRAWNETYALRAFLQYNAEFRIEFFNSWFSRTHPDEVRAAMPVCRNGLGSSIWIRRQ